jgi:hypothetical protein
VSFFKKLFAKGEAFVPTPTQNFPGLEPIVVQAIENLWQDTDDQKKAFKYAVEYKESKYGHADSTIKLLALLAMSNGIINELPDWTKVPGRDLADTFLTMKQAIAWVKSITKLVIENKD